jgi:predicted transcriptional regulator YheO
LLYNRKRIQAVLCRVRSKQVNREEALNFLNRLSEGLSKTFGRSCETVIHDMNNKKNSIISINNGHVTGRSIGDGLDLLGTHKEVNDFLDGIDLVNCAGRTSTGSLIKSSTFHMFGDDYHFAFGINFDYTYLSLAETTIKELTGVGESLEETMMDLGENKLKTIFNDCLKTVGKPVPMMSKSDRLRIIRLLRDKNAFSFQKSIPMISEELMISRYTLYNYLKEISRET